MHKHRCQLCHTVWEHTNSCAMSTLEVFQLAHTCPTCGAEVTEKYEGDGASEYVGRCTTTQLIALPTLARRIRL